MLVFPLIILLCITLTLHFSALLEVMSTCTRKASLVFGHENHAVRR